MGEKRERSIAGIVVGVIVSLVSAIIGAAGALHISGIQLDAALRAEERGRRADAYQAYVWATMDYFQDQSDLVRDPGDHCLFTRTYPEEPERPICYMYKEDRLRDSRRAWLSAYDEVVVFGTDRAAEAARKLRDAVAPISLDVRLPVSSTAWLYQRAAGRDPGEHESDLRDALDDINRLAQDLVLIRCEEASTSPARCSDAVANYF